MEVVSRVISARRCCPPLDGKLEPTSRLLREAGARMNRVGYLRVRAIAALVCALAVVALLALGCGEETATTTSGGTDTTAPATDTTAPATDTTAATSGEAKTIKIGTLGDQSGAVSYYYLPELNSIELCVDYINEMGGITVKGEKYQLELVSADTKFSAEGAVSAANKLIYDDKVQFVLGGLGMENTAVGPLFEENKIIRIQWYTEGGSEEVSADTKYTFVGANCAVAQYSVSIPTYLEKFPDTKKVALCFADSPGTVAWLIPKVLEPMLEGFGLEVVNKGDPILFPNEMTDALPIAQKVARLDPDLVVTSGTPNLVAQIMDGAHQSGSDAGWIGQPPGGVYPEVMGEEATKILIVQWPNTVTPDAPPIFEELMARLEAKSGPITPTTVITFSSGTNLMVLKAIIEKADSLDPDDIVATWLATDSVLETPQGEAYLSGDTTWGPNKAISAGYGYQLIMDGETTEGWTKPYVIP
jgi:branched-chain amino acid transport system substrate-binding protein